MTADEDGQRLDPELEREREPEEEQEEESEEQLDTGDPGPNVFKLVGALLKSLRQSAEMDRETFGARMGYSAHTIASVEQGRRRPPGPDFLDQADTVLRAGGLLKGAKKEVAKARLPAFFRGVAKLEETAVEYHSYQNQVVPGLLQTEDYARALYRMRRPALDDESIEEHVAARKIRQDILTRKPAPTMSFVIEEVVLHRPYGGRAILDGQRRRLLQVGQQRNMDIQIMPTDREEHAGDAGPLILLRAENEPMAVYVEAQDISALRTQPDVVRNISQQYETIRAQALNPRESMRYIEKLLGEQ
ncbi:helix-turn-helix domain-containing protein [Streptomyces millisiae]|uniref:Helix-turn-helix transcriptional regulator n=1 Tax=Streptomyces millisiae TaxID=3075542 RepID=A0ABU2LVF0_9ACTN|nr:helix-turn-helix transcriptional regulator [Streptomyces sp. DSM 44918]MDT0321554.1 helix-turn-helix transcriptional regulator [Streptomyces sp. DSM 44918]